MGAVLTIAIGSANHATLAQCITFHCYLEFPRVTSHAVACAAPVRTSATCF